METLTGGGNNRAYKLITHHKTFMGKVYFRDPADTRDRLWHERAFIGYLNRLGLEIAPKFVAMEERIGVAVYEWISGKTFEPESLVASNCWEQCCDFLIRLQLGRETGYARTVPRASESAFSLMEHWGLLQERHDFWLRLVKSDPESVPEEIRDFLLSTIESNYTGLGKEVLAHPSFKREITFDERILSPSDFGLHNTVKKENGTLCFIDFEYAGWDDPAKTIADFFAQPKQKVPKNFFKHMKNAIIEILPEEKIKYFIERLPLVVSITNLKWCYIILNSFHPTGRKRRTLSKASRVDHQTLLNSLKALMESPI